MNVTNRTREIADQGIGISLVQFLAGIPGS
jgi:hypothetical protein